MYPLVNNVHLEYPKVNKLHQIAATLGAAVPRFMTLTDVAEELQISTAAVRTMVLKGELEAFQIGGRGQWRVDSEKFENFIEQLHQEQRQRVVEADQQRTDQPQ